MKALLLVGYALGAPIGVGCLLFVLWRLEEGLLGSPPPGPLPEGDRPKPTTIDQAVTATSPSLLYVGAPPVDSNGYHQYLHAEPDLGFKGFHQATELSDRRQPGDYQADEPRPNGG